MIKNDFLTIYNDVKTVYLVYAEIDKIDEEWDKKSVKFLTFGDIDNPFAHNKEQLYSECKQMVNNSGAIAQEMVNGFMKEYGRGKASTTFINVAFLNNNVMHMCRRILNDTIDDWLPYHREINDKYIKMKPVRDAFTNAMVAASQPDTNMTLGMVNCFVEKWVDLIIKCVESDGAKVLVKLYITPILTYAMSSPRLNTCDWSHIPAPTGAHVRGTSMLIVKALLNLENQPKYRNSSVNTHKSTLMSHNFIVNSG